MGKPEDIEIARQRIKKFTDKPVVATERIELDELMQKVMFERKNEIY